MSDFLQLRFPLRWLAVCLAVFPLTSPLFADIELQQTENSRWVKVAQDNLKLDDVREKIHARMAAFSPDCNYILFRHADGLAVRELKSGTQFVIPLPPATVDEKHKTDAPIVIPFVDWDVNPVNGAIALVSELSKAIVFHDLHSGKLSESKSIPEKIDRIWVEPKIVRYDPQGRFLFVAAGGVILSWNLADGAFVGESFCGYSVGMGFKSPDGHDLLFDLEGQFVLSNGGFLFDKSGTDLKSGFRPAKSTGFSFDGKSIYRLERTGLASRWKLAALSTNSFFKAQPGTLAVHLHHGVFLGQPQPVKVVVGKGLPPAPKDVPAEDPFQRGAAADDDPFDDGAKVPAKERPAEAAVKPSLWKVVSIFDELPQRKISIATKWTPQACLSAKGKLLAVWKLADENHVNVYDLSTENQKPICEFQAEAKIRECIFSPDESILAIITDAGKLYVFQRKE